jgi:outer membrane protein OmpA-like peptidoglycan-associated protein
MLTACSTFRFDDSQAFITVSSIRSQVEPPIVAVRLLVEPLPKLPVLAPLSIEAPKPIIPNIVENILFKSDSSALSDIAVAQVDNFATVVSGGDYQILVEGHTDSNHSHEYNQALSEARATTVKEALIARGIEPFRLVTDYHGETKAVATNTNAQGKEQNRRVELRPLQPLPPLAPSNTDLKPLPPLAPSNTDLKPLPPLAPSNTDLKPLSPLQAITPESDAEVVDVRLNAPKKLEVQVNATVPTANVDAAASPY